MSRGAFHCDDSKLQAEPAIAPVPRSSMSSEALWSIELERRIKLMFDRFADRHGISHDEARILLLDTGIRL